jgi:hypothetical protein
MGIRNKILVLFLGLLSCNTLEENPIDLDLDYHPLKIGNFWEYQVLETLYFGESDAETRTFYFRDQIVSDFFNEEGDQVFLVQRQRSMDQENWEQEINFTYSLRKGILLKNLNNHITVSLIFPPKNGESWNANNYNGLPRDIYRIERLDNYSLGNLSMGLAVKVIQSEEDDLITLRDQRYEIYLKGVGMAESYFEVLTYCSRNDCLGEQIIDSGRLVRLELIKHG